LIDTSQDRIDPNVLYKLPGGIQRVCYKALSPDHTAVTGPLVQHVCTVAGIRTRAAPGAALTVR